MHRDAHASAALGSSEASAEGRQQVLSSLEHDRTGAVPGTRLASRASQSSTSRSYEIAALDRPDQRASRDRNGRRADIAERRDQDGDLDLEKADLVAHEDARSDPVGMGKMPDHGDDGSLRRMAEQEHILEKADVGIGEILDDDGVLRPSCKEDPLVGVGGHEHKGRPPPPTGLKLFLLLIGLLLIEFVVGLDNTIVATSTATIANDFRALQDVGWYGSAFLVATVGLQPLFGRAYAFFRQKWVLVFALVIFEVGCIVAAVAQSSPILILGRAIQGAGYAGLFIGILQICSNALSVRMQAMVTSLMNVS